MTRIPSADRASRLRERIDRTWAWIRSKGSAQLLELLVVFVLPFLIFVAARPSMGDVHALMASSAPPIAWTVVEFARKRRIDALSLLVLLGIALSLLAFLGGGGVRFLQLREKLVTATIGLVFLGSAAVGRPLIYQLARATMRRRSPDAGRSFEALKEHPLFRRAMLVMTLVWGIGLLLDAAISCVLVFALTIPQYLIVGPILGYSVMGALTAWTFAYTRRKVRAARQAVAEGVGQATGFRPS